MTVPPLDMTKVYAASQREKGSKEPKKNTRCKHPNTTNKITHRRKLTSPPTPHVSKSSTDNQLRPHAKRRDGMFSSDRTNSTSARNLYSLVSPREKVQSPKRVKKWKDDTHIHNSPTYKPSILISSESKSKPILMIRPKEKCLEFYFTDRKSMQADLKKHRGRVFHTEWLNSLKTAETKHELFKKLAKPTCADDIEGAVAQEIYDVIIDSGLQVTDFILELNRSTLIEMKAASSKGNTTLNRESSVLTRLMKTYFLTRMKRMLNRCVKKAQIMISKLPDAAFTPRKEEFRKIHAVSKFEKILDRVLLDTRKQVERIDFSAQLLFRRLYVQSGQVYTEHVGREQMIGIFFLCLLSPTLIGTKEATTDHEIQIQSRRAKVSSHLHKTLKESLSPDNMALIPQSLHPLFTGKGYEKRKALVEQIIARIVGITDKGTFQRKG